MLETSPANPYANFAADPEDLQDLPPSQTTTVSSAATASSTSWAVSINALELPPAEDPNELIRHRFLCRGGGLLLVGPTGVGKSSLSMQIMMSFALGRECLGYVPARPLKSLLIQAENDDGDLAEFRDGVFGGLNLNPEERAIVGENVIVATEDSRAGSDFCALVMAPLLKEHQPDLLWIDPALAYVPGDANSQKDVGELLRRGINPLIHQYQCGTIIIHHTPKPIRSTDGKNSAEQDLAYAGAGSAEWMNWARATITLSRLTDGVFRIVSRKRGTRLRWTGVDGQPVIQKTISHCRDADRIWWVEVPPGEEPPEAKSGGKAKPRKTLTDLIELVPLSREMGKAELQRVAQDAGINEKLFRQLLSEGLEEERLFQWKRKRTTGPPAVIIARFPQPAEVLASGGERDERRSAA